MFSFLLLQLDYDTEFGTLTRSRPRFPLDGYPLVAGLACLLKQFHPLVTRQTLQFIGVFVRATLLSTYGPTEADGKVVDMPVDISLLLVFVQQLCAVLMIPKEQIYEFIPSYIFETAKTFVK